jgi:UDP-glucuronate 4-epimerase
MQSERLDYALNMLLEGEDINLLKKHAERISEDYRDGTGPSKRIVNDAKKAKAYAASRMPATYRAVYDSLRYVISVSDLCVSSVLDVGAGTGAGIFACTDLLQAEDITLLEREESMISIGKQLFSCDSLLSSARWIKASVQDIGTDKKYDLVTASYVMNELNEEDMLRTAEKLWDITGDTLLIVEPGTPKGYANILVIRDILLQKGAYITAPCTHAGKCPMVEDDWYHLSERLLKMNHTVVGLDNLNDYYDVNLKLARLNLLKPFSKFAFHKIDLVDKEALNNLFAVSKFDIIVNLAAQAGVRYSITNPEAYINSNIVGFLNVLEACRHYPVKHLVYASSSSVYGSNKKVPYSTEDKTDNPVSLYAATKKSNELMAHAYSKLYNIPTTGLRFFTVYGPMGRPDMALFDFTNKMIKGEKIQIFNYGDMKRDFTYIDDIVTGVVNVMGKVPDKNEDNVPYKLYNIGNNKPENLMFFVKTIEGCLMNEGLIDKPAEKELLPMQPGDVYQTYAEVDDLIQDFGFKPNTTLEEGITRFIKWYMDYMQV